MGWVKKLVGRMCLLDWPSRRWAKESGSRSHLARDAKWRICDS